MRRRWLLRLGGLLLLGGGLVAVGWLALAPLAPRPAAERELLYAIPKGAGARAGSDSRFVLPSTVRLVLGVRDILVLRNDDTVPMQIGPLRLAPGQSYRLPFHQPGALQLACSFHQGIGFVLFVDPPPSPGWERLRWRLDLMGSPAVPVAREAWGPASGVHEAGQGGDTSFVARLARSRFGERHRRPRLSSR